MKRNSSSEIQNSKYHPHPDPLPSRERGANGAAFLWDESFLWGLMAYKALKALGLPFDLVKAEDVKAGVLNNYKMLFVPGGWASNKSKALSDKGTEEIREFVKNGGNYLGFCGGAGLATLDGIGLLNIKRKPTKERVPSFSGRIHLNISEHKIWNELIECKSAKVQECKRKADLTSANNSSLIFHAWWPSQFILEDKNIKILATYGDALPDAFSSDINVGDVESDIRWEDLEKIYQINLNPDRLKNEPSVIEGAYGKGKVILSLVHFDTPEDANGQMVLRNLWEYLGSQNSAEARKCGSAEDKKTRNLNFSTSQPLNCQSPSEIFDLCSDLISLGERNFLWFWRNPMLLQWRRGVRGLEYNTLFIMMKEIAAMVQKCKSTEAQKYKRNAAVPSFADDVNKTSALLTPFVDKAKRLLILERHAMQKGHITYERCDDADIQALRKELFSDSKSHGGMFKELIDEVDSLLFLLLT